MRRQLLIALALLVSGSLSQDAIEGSGELEDQAAGLVDQYIEAALDDANGVQQDVNAREISANNPTAFDENQEIPALEDNTGANFEQNADTNPDDVDARGFEDAGNEEEMAEEPPQENTEDVRSYEEGTPTDYFDERSLEGDQGDTKEARDVEDEMEAISKQYGMEARSQELDETEPPIAEDLAAGEDLEARSMEEGVEPTDEEDMDLADEEDLEARDMDGPDDEADGDDQMSKRSSLGLARIVSRSIGWRNASRLMGYGCFCGFRRSRRTRDKKLRQPVDALDKCCLARRRCYAAGTRGNFWKRQCRLSFALQPFRYVCKGSTCVCRSLARSCAGKACKCVTDFAKCVRANWSSYNPKNRRNCK